jgi:hypothetical protein
MNVLVSYCSYKNIYFYNAFFYLFKRGNLVLNSINALRLWQNLLMVKNSSLYIIVFCKLASNHDKLRFSTSWNCDNNQNRWTMVVHVTVEDLESTVFHVMMEVMLKTIYICVSLRGTCKFCKHVLKSLPLNNENIDTLLHRCFLGTLSLFYNLSFCHIKCD